MLMCVLVNLNAAFLCGFQLSLSKKEKKYLQLSKLCFVPGNLYVALEYLPGNNLHKHLLENGPNQQQRKPLTIMQKLKFSVDIAKGMQHLSEAGVSYFF